jgi:hypothetical protein
MVNLNLQSGLMINDISLYEGILLLLIAILIGLVYIVFSVNDKVTTNNTINSIQKDINSVKDHIYNNIYSELLSILNKELLLLSHGANQEDKIMKIYFSGKLKDVVNAYKEVKTYYMNNKTLDILNDSTFRNNLLGSGSLEARSLFHILEEQGDRKIVKVPTNEFLNKLDDINRADYINFVKATNVKNINCDEVLLILKENTLNYFQINVRKIYQLYYTHPLIELEKVEKSNETLSNIKILIQNNKTGQAINEIVNITLNDDSLNNIALLLKSRYINHKEKVIAGIDDDAKERDKIISSALSLLQLIEKQ